MDRNRTLKYVADCALGLPACKPAAQAPAVCEMQATWIVKTPVAKQFDAAHDFGGEISRHDLLARLPERGTHLGIARDNESAFEEGQAFTDRKAEKADVPMRSNRFSAPCCAER